MKKIFIIIISVVLVVISLTFINILFKNNMSSKINKSKEIVLDNEKVKLLYKESFTADDRRELDVYNDNLGNSYMFYHGKNKISGFVLLYHKKTNIKSGVSLTIDQIKAKADANLKNLVDLSKYTFYKVTNPNEMGFYNVQYEKKIQGYKTSDKVSISLNKQGRIESFSGVYQGAFDNFNLKIDSRKIDNNVVEFIKKNYGNRKYNIFYKELQKDIDGKYIIQMELVRTDSPNGFSLKVDIATGAVSISHR